jgi:hypothetical protein
LWLHAHTKDRQWTVDDQIRELWFAEVSERTPLTQENLLDGTVDVSWFHAMHRMLGAKHWTALLDSAKYASGGNGHKRAELFAQALLGETTTEALAGRIREKRHQDSLCALGLVPLPRSAKAARAQILQRYEIVQTFLKGSKKFGAQQQASEKLAAQIGLENLARTAGYPDAQRLSWAMEAEAGADLRRGPVEVVEGGVAVRLEIDPSGDPQISIMKAGKTLKEIPATLRKSTAIAALRARRTELAGQSSRMRLSLEESMVRGDVFKTSEIHGLLDHPLLKPHLEQLVFVDGEGKLAYAAELGREKGDLRIAHPVDLLASGDWSRWQQDCFTHARRQPFKQVFRELYLLTEAERLQKDHSSRYEGQQVNPRQAIALAGARGWVSVPEEGIRRTFHREGLSARTDFLEGFFTPAEVDGLTVRHVTFTRRGDWRALGLAEVPPRVFSEAMRDLDLVVSVAHRGGVDAEATASTIEMRTALLSETLRLLKIANVRLAGSHAFVEGALGSYNVHLGSGVVHRQPGGALCIVPVHSQHRGRIFLPFADDDPKTAEVVSKILLLARDATIQDPTILEQLRGG